jgi:CIC family chloride channel protein
MKWIRLRFAGLLDQVQPPETAVMLATAVTVGAGTGLGAILFIRLIAFVQTLFFESGAIWFGFMGRGVFIIAPLIGGLLAGPGAFAIVGMAAVFAGAARAPFTAILIVFEITDDYHMIVPLMAGVMWT